MDGDITTITGEMAPTRSIAIKILLACGILAPLMYLAEDLVASMLWQGYSLFSQAFSDYSALGAPTRSFILVFSPIYSALIIAFGVGIWKAAGQRRALRLIGALFVIYALVSWIWPQFYPIHLIAAEASSSDFVHIILTFTTIISWFLILGFGAFLFGKRFRLYTILTFLAVLIGGALAGYIVTTTPSAVTQSAPWLGVVERVNIYSFMLWEIILVTILLRAKKGPVLISGDLETKAA